MKHTITIGVAVAALIALSGCGGRGGKSIGRAFGDHISQDDLHHFMDDYGTPAEPSVLVRTGNGEANAELSGTFAFQALRRMMVRQATIALARSRGVAPTPDDIEKELTFRGHLTPGYLQQMTGAGLTMSRVKDMIEFDLARENLLCQGVVKQDPATFVKEHPKDFMTPETAELLWIFAKSEDRMKEVDRELQAGQDFATVAREKTEAPGPVDTRFQFRYKNVAQMDKQIQDVVHETQPDSASTRWVHFPKIGGWGKFYVGKKTQAAPLVPNEYQMKQLGRSLAESRGAMGKDLDQDVLNFMLDNKDKFVVEDNTLKGMWSQWLDEMATANSGGKASAGSANAKS